MRIALISDLHANAYALETVLADIARVGVDRLICLGDCATLGASPVYVLERLQALGCTCIMGNHDEFLLEAELIKRYTETPVVVQAVHWCREQLSPALLDFIRTFERQVSLDLAPELAVEGRPGISCLLFHGSPRSHMEEILAGTSIEQLDGALDGQKAEVMAGGHTHVQMLRQHHGMLLVNPGSVGMPFQAFGGGKPPVLMPTTEYAVIEGSARGVEVQLKRLKLEPARLLDEVQRVAHPLREFLSCQYREFLPR